MPRNPKSDENIKNFRERGSKKAKECGKKGGIASGEARRRNADIRKAMAELLKMPATGRAKELVDSMEFTDEEKVNANALVAKLFNMAIAGNQRAMELIMDYTFKVSDDERKTKESAARIKALAKNGVDVSVESKDGDDGGVIIYLPEIEKEPEDGKESDSQKDS